MNEFQQEPVERADEQASQQVATPEVTAGVQADAMEELGPPPPPGRTPVLQKLSSPPFQRTGFPLLGILASAYEHVIEVMARAGRTGRQEQAKSSNEGQAA